MKRTTLYLSCLLTIISYFLLTTACLPPPPPERYKGVVFSQHIIHEDVVYGRNAPLNGAMQDLTMNIYEPEGDSLEQRPVIIVAHGGFFLEGEKEQYHWACVDLAKFGFVAATIDYRLWKGDGFPDSNTVVSVAFRGVSDMKAAVRFFKKDAATTNKYKIDPDKIIVGGFSAGGTMALLTAYADITDPFPQYILDTIAANGGIHGNSGHEAYDSEVLLAINLAGNIPSEDLIDSGDQVPLFSHHDRNDPTAPYDFGMVTYPDGSSGLPVVGAKRIHERLDELGIDNFLHTTSQSKHSGELSDAAVEDLMGFMYSYVE